MKAGYADTTAFPNEANMHKLTMLCMLQGIAERTQCLLKLQEYTDPAAAESNFRILSYAGNHKALLAAIGEVVLCHPFSAAPPLPVWGKTGPPLGGLLFSCLTGTHRAVRSTILQAGAPSAGVHICAGRIGRRCQRGASGHTPALSQLEQSRMGGQARLCIHPRYICAPLVSSTHTDGTGCTACQLIPYP